MSASESLELFEAKGSGTVPASATISNRRWRRMLPYQHPVRIILPNQHLVKVEVNSLSRPSRNKDG